MLNGKAFATQANFPVPRVVERGGQGSRASMRKSHEQPLPTSDTSKFHASVPCTPTSMHDIQRCNIAQRRLHGTHASPESSASTPGPV